MAKVSEIRAEDARALWKELSGADGRRTPNADPDIFFPVCRALGFEPVVVRVSSEDTPAVLFARKEMKRSVRRIGYARFPLPRLRTLQVVYGGHFFASDPHGVVSAMESIRSQYPAIDQICLSRVPVETSVYRGVASLRGAVVHPAEPHIALELSESFDKTMSVHSSKHRQRLRWEFKKLGQTVHELSIHTLTEERDIESILRDAELIGNRTYHAKVGGLVADGPVWRAVAGAHARGGGLRAHFMHSGSDPIAFVLCANREDRMHVLAMAHLKEHEKYSPGKHLLLHAIRRACEDGMRWVDYGFGDAQYKRVYSNHVWSESDITLYSPRLLPTAVCAIDRILLSAQRHSGRIVGAGAVQRIRRSWRRFLARKQPGSGAGGDRRDDTL